jgi:phospholipase/carboxylesterase
MLLVAACSVLLVFNVEKLKESFLNNPANSENVEKNIEYLEYQTGLDPSYSVIWLHGLGADGHDFEPIAPQLGISPEVSVRFVFPHAPLRPITVNGGMEMRGWYDIVDMPLDDFASRTEDRKGYEDSAKIVQQLIEQENQRGVATQNIFLAGFSQGGVVALFQGLRHSEKLAGIIALSTYLPAADSTEEERDDSNLDVPIFYGHGTQDPIIPVSMAEKSREKLEQLGYVVEWHTYDMPHSVHPLEIRQIGSFINAQLKP